MFNFITTLAEANGYSALELDASPPDASIYIGGEFQDILIISAYNREEILNFFDVGNGKTASIMGLYDLVLQSNFSDSAKDMQLVLCYQINSISSLKDDIQAKHKIMQLEENKFGMRISVLKYTADVMQILNSEQDIITAINSKVDSSLNDDDGVIAADMTIDAALKSEPSFTALQLYTKLPFLSLRNFEAASSIEPINKRLEKIIGEDSTLVERILNFKESKYGAMNASVFVSIFLLRRPISPVMHSSSASKIVDLPYPFGPHNKVTS